MRFGGVDVLRFQLIAQRQEFVHLALVLLGQILDVFLGLLDLVDGLHRFLR